jgi:hypothetical protein
MDNFGTRTALTIDARSVASIFTIFYDLRVRIVGEVSETKKHERKCGFSWFDTNDCTLNRFFVSDRFLRYLVAAQFHGDPSCVGEQEHHSQIEVTAKGTSRSFEFVSHEHLPGHDADGQPSQIKIPDCAAFSAILFRNGILAVTVRLSNAEKITDREYVDLIKRPEYVYRHNTELRQEPGGLIAAVWKLREELELSVATYLNLLELQAVTLEGGTAKPLFVHHESSPNDDFVDTVDVRSGEHDPSKIRRLRSNGGIARLALGGTIDLDDGIYHRLKASRPFIGSVIDLNNPSDARWNKQRAELLAIACARTTPEFIDIFVRPHRYLTETDDRRNIYYPGPSVFLIGRRGWACIKREQRKPIAFWLGVVEPVHFSIIAVYASVRATRRLLRDVIEEGERVSIRLNTTLGNPPQANTSAGSGDLSIAQEFTKFLARARLSGPTHDMSILLRSHVTTHTAIAAVRRIQQLTDHEQLLRRAQETITNYSGSLDAVNQLRAGKQDHISGVLITLTRLTLFLGIAALGAAIAGSIANVRGPFPQLEGGLFWALVGGITVATVLTAWVMNAWLARVLEAQPERGGSNREA